MLNTLNTISYIFREKRKKIAKHLTTAIPMLYLCNDVNERGKRRFPGQET